MGTTLMKMNMSEISEIHSYIAVVESLCRYRFVIPSLDWRVCAYFFKGYLYITQEFIHL